MNVLVTGGGTIAPIDAVRQITNTSTGRFSASLTEACLRQGAQVWHLHTPSALLPFQRSARLDLTVQTEELAREHVRLDQLRADYQSVSDRLHLVPLKTGRVAEYAAALEQTLRTNPMDVAFLAMAVSDYEPESVPGKIESDRETLLIRCRKTPKVIRSVRDWSPDVFLVGFKLLSEASTAELIQRAEESNITNRADLTIANDLRTVQADRHVVHLVRPGEQVETLGPSEQLADDVVGRVFALAAERGAGR